MSCVAALSSPCHLQPFARPFSNPPSVSQLCLKGTGNREEEEEEEEEGAGVERPSCFLPPQLKRLAKVGERKRGRERAVGCVLGLIFTCCAGLSSEAGEEVAFEKVGLHSPGLGETMRRRRSEWERWQECNWQAGGNCDG